MEAIRQRVSARMQNEHKVLASELAELTKKRAVALKEAAKIRGNVEAVLAHLDEGKVPTKALRQHVDRDAAIRLIKLIEDIVKFNERNAAIVAQMAKLKSDAELERRVKEAKATGFGEDIMSGPQAARVVLLHAGRPLHVKDISRKVLESGTVKLKPEASKGTPDQTMSAYLAKAAKKGDTFVRVAPGVYDLLERQQKPPKDKPDAKPVAEPEKQPA